MLQISSEMGQPLLIKTNPSLMITNARKHRILITHPLSEAALQRLSFFFEIRIVSAEQATPTQSALSLLQDVAGVITSKTTFSFKKETIAQLPHLRAICLLEHHAPTLDLNALTQAGIRATSLPTAAATDVGETLWTTLATTLQNHAAPTPSASLNKSALKRFSGSLFSSSFQGLVLGILGESPMADRLHSRAQQAKAQTHKVSIGQLYKEIAVDWLIIPPDWFASSTPLLGSCILSNLPASARILDFSATPVVEPLLRLLPAWSDRIVHRPLRAAPVKTQIDLSTTVAEQLIAALGFGRKSWHPDNLLNPDVCCESCC